MTYNVFGGTLSLTKSIITNSDHAIVAQMTNSHEQYLTARFHERLSAASVLYDAVSCMELTGCCGRDMKTIVQVYWK